MGYSHGGFREEKVQGSSLQLLQRLWVALSVCRRLRSLMRVEFLHPNWSACRGQENRPRAISSAGRANCEHGTVSRSTWKTLSDVMVRGYF